MKISPPSNLRTLFLVLVLAVLGIFSPRHAMAVPAGYSEYLIPISSEQMWNIFTNMDNDPVLTASGGTSFGLHCVVGITINTPNTTVYYDHWEDGLDFDPANLATADETFTGATRGQVIKLESSNIPVAPRGTTLKYDGRDRLYVAGGTVTVTLSYWPESIGTVYADAWEIYPTKQFQTAYTIPVGEDLATAAPNYEDFNRCYIVVQASEDATSVTIDDPLVSGVQVTTTLNKGQVTQYFRSNSGTTINSNKPVQVQYVTGQPQAGLFSECRGYTAVPSTIWDSAYYCPVPSGGNADNDGNSYRTEIYIRNPTASPLTMRWRDSTGTGTASLPANTTRSYTQLFAHSIPTTSGAYIAAEDGVTKFDAIGSGNSLNIQANQNANYDYGFSLVPANLLRNEYFLGWAPGTRDLSNNGSPAFITAVNDGTTVFVDWNADGVPEQTQTLNSLQVLKGRDTGDNDNSGMRITATGPIAVVWGEDAVTAVNTDPYLDVGYNVVPQLDENIDLVLSVDKTANPTSIPKGVGQTSTFTLVTTTSAYTVDNVSVVDTLPTGWAFVANSATITLPNGTTITGANANPTISGQNLTWNDFSPGVAPNPDPLDMLANQTLTITFQGITTSTSAVGFSTNQVASTGTRGTQTFTATDDATVFVAELSVLKTSSANGNTTPGSTITYTMTVTNSGSTPQNNVVVGDPLPAGTTYVSQSTTVSIPAGIGNYRDEFSAVLFTNTNGNVVWPVTRPWVETGDNGLPGTGKVQITGGVLRFGGISGDNTTDEVTRIVDLASYGTLTASTLTFNLTNSGDLEATGTADTLVVQYSTDGTTFTTFPGGTFANNAATGAQSLTIPPAARTANLRIRFQVTGLGDGTSEFINVDDVNVAFTTTALTRDNIPAGANPDISNGVPPSMVTAADGLDILVPGGTMVVTYQALVANPTPANQSTVVNTVSVTSDEQTTPATSTVTDNLPPVTIGDRAWNDANANGVQDGGEVGIDGVTVDLYRPGYGPDGIPNNTDDNNIVATTSTSGGGIYSFSRLPGTYYAVFAPVAGSVRTSADQGGNDTTDSDANVTTGQTNTISLTSGQSNLTLDAGYYQPVTIGDFVFNDANANGQQDGIESGLAGVVVTLKDGSGNDIDSDPNTAGVQPTTQTTLASGAYSFTGLPPGSYRVSFSTLSGYNRTLANSGPDGTDSDADVGTGLTASYSLASGAIDNSIDAGYYQPATIGDFVWNDTNANGQQDLGETGISGVTVTLYRPDFGLDGITGNGDDALPVATDTTGGAGDYEFTGLPPGTYVVEFGTLPGYARTLANTGNDATDSDANPGTGLTGSILLATGATDKTIDAGYYLPGTVFGHLYIDTNGNETQDPGEPNLANVDVIVTDVNGATQTVSTNSTGDWSAIVPPGSTTADVDANDPQYPTGYTQTEGDDPTTVTAVSGTNTDAGNDGYFLPGAITGTVRADNNNDGIVPFVPLQGVTLTLLNGNGSPYLVGGNPVTTVTDVNGEYSFTGLPPGTYQVFQTQPTGYGSYSDKDGGDPRLNLIGDVTLVAVTAGATNTLNDFLEFLQACPDLWVDWQAKWAANPLVGPGQTGTTQNPDGDRYRNIEEYAFCMPPHSGINDAFCIGTPNPTTGILDGVFSRTAGAPDDVTYYLDRSPSLGLTPTPTSWTSILLDGSNTVITNDGLSGREMVRIIDLEAKTGLTSGAGFVRIRAVLNDGTTVATGVTEVHGWKESDIEACGLTYNNPFVPCLVFTGTVTGTSGLALDLSGSTGPINLANALNANLLVYPGASYYIEVTSGDNEGHRFDVNVASATATGISVLSDSTLDSVQAPYNTLVGPPPASLAGDKIELRRHFTLKELCPAAAFGSSNDPTSGDLLQIFAGGVYINFGLFTNSGNPIWVREGDDTLSDGGTTIVPPGQGIFINGHQEVYDTSILAYGEVRSNKFIRPLSLGFNLVGGGYPVDQAATGRTMTIAANAFFGNTNYTLADQFLIWRKDFNIADSGFQNYFLFKVGTIERWPKAGDGTLTDEKNAILFPGNRAAFYSIKTVKPLFTMPCPWNP